jgi:hypothetical protein
MWNPNVKRDVLLSIGLLPLCYGAFMWLTFDGHRGADHVEQVAEANTIEHTSSAKTVAHIETAAIESDEPANPEEIDASEMFADPEFTGQEEAASLYETPNAALPGQLPPPSHSPQTHTVQSLSTIIEQSADRESRVIAVNTLLLMGRKSMVDPAVIAALRKAANVPDTAVSSLAISALAEVERETH